MHVSPPFGQSSAKGALSLQLTTQPEESEPNHNVLNPRRPACAAELLVRKAGSEFSVDELQAIGRLLSAARLPTRWVSGH